VTNALAYFSYYARKFFTVRAPRDQREIMDSSLKRAVLIFKVPEYPHRQNFANWKMKAFGFSEVSLTSF
jgi:hypothetical protein